MQRLDTSSESPWVSAVVYGRSGAGKSSLGVTAPKPLILLSEAQGMLAIRQAAKRLGVPVPPVIFLETLEDCRNVLRALRGPKTEPFRVLEVVGYDPETGQALRDDTGAVKRRVVFELPAAEWPETVVLDTTTDMMRLVEQEIREQSPPKQGRDGLPVDSERFWNVLGDRCKNVLYGFRDAPLHKLFLCQEDDRDIGEGDEKRRNLGPAMPMRKLPALLSGCGNLTAYAYRREVRENQNVRVVYGVMTTGPEYMMLKPCAPLRPAERADFSFWVKAIRGTLEGGMPAAPAPSAESLAQGVSEADLPQEPQREAPAAPAAKEAEEAPPPMAEPPKAAKAAKGASKRGAR